jgi:hypothetical protein
MARACRGYASCRAPRPARELGGEIRRPVGAQVAVADAGPERAPTRNCAGPSPECRRRR